MTVFRTMLGRDSDPDGANTPRAVPLATVVHAVAAAIGVLEGPGGELVKQEDDAYLIEALCAAIPELASARNHSNQTVKAVCDCVSVRLAMASVVVGR